MNVLLGQVRRQVLGVHQPVKIGRFELLRRLGAGAMGVVYLARDPELDREVAIKHLHPTIVDSPNADAAQKRMQLEARAMARLTHPNVVAVYESGTDQSQLYIAMEYVEGQTLRDWLDAETKRPWQRVLEVFLAAGEGLAAAHDAGLVHRDFKPQNVLMSKAGAVKVSDFGLASAVGPFVELGPQLEATTSDELELSEPDFAQLAVSATGGVLGTPAYMSPECHSGKPADARADQFSFCVALYEALFGERPFAASSYAELASAVAGGHMRARPRRSSVPAWLIAVLERGLAAAPDQRWPSMAALLAALRDDPRARRRRRLGLAALVLAGVGVAAAALAQRHEHATQVATCEAHGEQIREIWNPDVRAELEASFADASAVHVVDQVALTLDDYVEQWSATRRELCLDSEVRNTWEPELARRGVRCLDAHRSWAELLLHEFAGLEGPAFIHTSTELMALPELAPCSDPAYLRGLPELPETLEHAQRELNLALLQVVLLRKLDRLDEAVALAERAHEDATQLNWPPLLARAKLELGISYMRVKRPFGSIMVEDAYFLAIANDAIPTASASATAMAVHAGHIPGMRSEASRWLRHARAALTHLDHPNADLRDQLDEAALFVAPPQQALQIGEDLLVRVRERFGAEHPRVAHTSFKLANVYRGVGRSEEAEAMLEQALTLEQRWFGTSGQTYRRMLIGLARCKSELGDEEAARGLYERALALAETNKDDDPLGISAIVERLGRLHERAGKFGRARDYYERDLAIHESWMGREHPIVATKHQSLGRVLRALDEPERALAQFEAALAIHLKRTGLDGVEDMLALHAQALAQREAGQLDAALELYARALERQAQIKSITSAPRGPPGFHGGPRRPPPGDRPPPPPGGGALRGRGAAFGSAAPRPPRP